MAERFTFWLNELGLHMAPLIRVLAGTYDVCVVADHGVNQNRVRQGWAAPDHGPASVVVAPTSLERLGLERRRGDSHHFFFGLGTYDGCGGSLVRVSKSGRAASVSAFSEPWDSRGWRGRLRPLKYRSLVREHGPFLDALLAAGELGADQFRSCGIDAEKLHKFPYFTEVPALSDNSQMVAAGRVKLAFIGQLIPRKAPLDVLAAASKLEAQSVSLDIFGYGHLRAKLLRAASDSPVEVGVRGPIDHDALPRVLSDVDVLVLPSRFDGWGVVVNEALASGCRVVASDAVTAADLVRVSGFGQVVPAADVGALHSALRREVRRGRRTAAERRQIQDWVRHNISPEVGAGYLEWIVQGAAGEPPSIPFVARRDG